MERHAITHSLPAGQHFILEFLEVKFKKTMEINLNSFSGNFGDIKESGLGNHPDHCPDGNQWIWRWFADCIRSPIDMVSFCLGLCGIVLFLISILPQLYKNYKRKNVEGLSFSFFFIWFLGDVCNFCGAILTRQIATVQVTGAYFVLTGLMMALQLIYYRKIYPKFGYKRLSTKSDEEIDVDHDDDDDDDGIKTRISFEENFEAGYIEEKENRGSTTSIHKIPFPSASILPCVVLGTLLSTSFAETSEGHPFFLQNTHKYPAVTDHDIYVASLNENPANFSTILGSVFAWASGTLYFYCRIPQIITNYKFKDVEGLSIALFFLTLSANILYGLAIALRFPPIDAKFIQSTLPYLIGSVGTFALDLIIIIQAIIYGNHDESHFISKLRRLLGW